MAGSPLVLQEILDVMQEDPAVQRRWFHDDYFDLFVMQSGSEVSGFQLCYGIDTSEQALVWSKSHGYFHDGTPKSGDVIGGRLNSGEPIEADPIIARFAQAAEGMPDGLRLALLERLREFALQDAGGSARRKRFRRAAWQAGARKS
jgi:hypothetical protein